MKAYTGIACLAAGVLSLIGGTIQAQPGGTVGYAEKSFMREAAQGGVAEVKLGALAATQGSRESVRRFGQHMVDDHSKAGDELRQVARDKGISLPGTMDSESRALYNRLSRLHGAAFDSAYIKAMREDHEKDIQVFRREANNGRDRDVKAFASKTLPTLRHHYEMVLEISSSLRAQRASR